MANFSTPREALLPRTVNLATLVVVVAATWWSGAQRPVAQDRLIGQANQPAVQQPAAQTAIVATTATTAAWPAQATSLTRDGLQPVAFQTRTAR